MLSRNKLQNLSDLCDDVIANDDIDRMHRSLLHCSRDGQLPQSVDLFTTQDELVKEIRMFARDMDDGDESESHWELEKPMTWSAIEAAMSKPNAAERREGRDIIDGFLGAGEEREEMDLAPGNYINPHDALSYINNELMEDLIALGQKKFGMPEKDYEDVLDVCQELKPFVTAAIEKHDLREGLKDLETAWKPGDCQKDEATDKQEERSRRQRKM